MIQSEPWQKLQQMLSGDEHLITANMITVDQDGYDVFGCYRICALGGLTVFKKHNLISEFTSTKTALSWCIADKYNQRDLANKILRLDRDRERLANDISLQELQAKHYKNAHTRDMVLLKVSQKKGLLKNLNHDLSKCGIMAKYWQIKGFNDEIARTRRPAPHRPNRPSARKSFGKNH